MSEEERTTSYKGGTTMRERCADALRLWSRWSEAQAFLCAVPSILLSIFLWGSVAAIASSMEVVVDVRKGISSESINWPEIVKGDTWTLSTKGNKLVVILRSGETVCCYPESVILRRKDDVLKSNYIIFPVTSRDKIVKQAQELWPQLRIDDKKVVQDISAIELGKINSSKYLERHYNNLIESEGRDDGIDCVSVLVTKSYSSDNTARFQCHLYIE